MLPVLLSGVLPYVEADGLALEAFMAAQGDPQAAQGGPQDDGSGQHIWAAEHIEVGLDTHLFPHRSLCRDQQVLPGHEAICRTSV